MQDKELASEYLAGAVLLGAAPCTAMVFVWSKLTRGDSAYTLVQVASNDLIIFHGIFNKAAIFNCSSL
jgi:ACR3 family arsenical resistance-3 transporter